MKLIPARWTAKAVLIFVFTLLISLTMLAQAPPSGDTFASSSTPRQNYGSWPLLAVQQGTNSYIQFNLSNIPANTSITKATLRLYIDAVGRGGQFDVYQIDSAWSENTLTYSNAPQLGSSATGGQATTVSASSLNQFVLIDITPLVQQWINGTLPNNGIALSLTSSNGSFSFDSKESEFTSHEPELEITLAGGTGQQGPPGPQGPAGPQGAQGPQGIPGNLNPGSPYYIQNGTTAQSGASFNVSGNGTVGGTLAGQLVNSVTGYQINGATEFSVNGANDVIVGPNAGNTTMTGNSIQIIGDGAGQSVTSGNSDVFIGTHAGQHTTTGNGDVYIGLFAGQSATTAAYNIFIGAQVGAQTTTGSSNAFIGFDSGSSNTTGYDNVALGASSGASNTTGLGNTYVGFTAGLGATTGNYNTMVGGQTGGTSGETSSNNSFFGWNAGTNNTTGQNNLFLGIDAGGNNVAGSNNIYLASDPADESNTIRIGSSQQATYVAGIYGASTSSGQPVYIDSTGHLGTGGGSGGGGGSGVSSFNGRTGAVVPAAGDYSFAMLSGTLPPSELTGTFTQAVTFNNSANSYSGAGFNSTSGYQINGTTQFNANSGNDLILGASAGNATMTGGAIQIVGDHAGQSVTTGNADVFVGSYAGQSTTTGNGDVYVGVASGQSGTTAAYNTFVGGQSGALTTTGANDTFIGFNAGFTNTTGSFNAFVGQNAGISNTTGADNTALGAGAAQGNTTGSSNVYIGFLAGLSETNANSNTFVGAQAGENSTTAYNNTFLGVNAGLNDISGNNNLYLGDGAGSNNSNGSYNVYLATGGANESNTIRLGDPNSQTSTYIAGIYGVTSGSGVPVYINSNGQLGTLTSSRKYKENIQDMGDLSDRLMKLRPVTFYYKAEYDNGPRTLQFGLIAEEVAKVFPDLVAYNPDGTPYTVRYQYLSSILLD